MNDTHNFILKNISGINSAHMLVGLYPTVWSPDFKSCVFFFFFSKCLKLAIVISQRF